MKPPSITLLLLFALAFTGIGAQESTTDIESPDGNIHLTVSLHHSGLITYAVMYGGRDVIRPSHLGFSLVKPMVELSKFRINDVKTSEKDETWEPVLGEVAHIRNHYKELVLHLESLEDNILLDLRFRVFNDGVGFRYEFPEQEALDYFILAEEHTEFAMAGDHRAFWIPGDYDTNEYLYNTSRLSEIDALSAAAREKDISVSSPIGANAVQTPLMLTTDDGLFINLHEAALLNYSTMDLLLDKASLTFSSHLVPDAVGNKGYLETPAKTPWRTVVVSDNAAGILASKMILNLNEPSVIEDTSWIKPQKFIGVWWEMHIGKGTWEYAGGHHAANTANVKKYIDFASEFGFDGVLVEGWNEGWEDWFGNWKEDVFDFVTPYPDYDIDALTQYAAEKGVKIIMHHETSGSVTNYERRMDKAFTYMKTHGINTVKTGYVGKIIPRGEHHDGQWMNNHFARVARKAAEYRIMLEAHEPSHPTGLNRTFPNWLANEAARGNEFNNAPTLGITPEHQTILPFTRLMGGPMDFTPGLFHFKLNQFIPSRTTEVRTTLAKQLALYITMYSPLQMAGDLPENYRAHPDAFQFIVDVPLDWQETRILEAAPGDFVTIARKEKGSEDWYIGGITDENARECLLHLDFLSKGSNYVATIYRDGKNAHWDRNPESYLIENKKVRSGQRLKIPLAEGGGFAIRIHHLE
jgi:hypothetical protein